MIVDDDAEIRELISMYLKDQGFQTVEASEGEEAVRNFPLFRPDLVILDVLLPGMDGFIVGEQIRRQSFVPIIYLTSKWETGDIVKGLEVGGDDYVTKPFMPDVLLARVKANLRRAQMSRTYDTIVFGDLEINKETYEVRFRGEEIRFLSKEVKLFIFMAEHPRKAFSADQLYEQVWEYGDGDARTVMVHISNIRRKLKTYAPGTVMIETLKGIGYRLINVGSEG